MVAVAVIGSSVIGGVAGIAGSAMGANAQENAAKNATAAQLQMFNQSQADLSPYNQMGQIGENSLMNMLPSLEAPINMDEATLKNTPGYQFTLNQGLQSVQNSAAARGLASSGAALKGAAGYATGLADTTYQQQFQNALANKQMALTSAVAPIQVGESAAAGQASSAINTGQSIGSNLIGAGNAAAAGYVGGANAISGASSNIGNLYLSNALMQGMYGQGILGGSGNSGASIYNMGTGPSSTTDVSGLTG